MQQADDVSSYAREDCPRIHGVRSLMNYSTTQQEESVSKVLGYGCSYVSIQQSQSHHFLPKPSYYPSIQNFSGCNVTIIMLHQHLYHKNNILYVVGKYNVFLK